MRILFTGSIKDNNGPANVNRELVHHWPADDQIMIINGTNKFARLLNFLPKLIAADVVIAIGGTKLENIAASYVETTHKKMVVLSHGYLPFENKINNLHYSKTEMMKNKNFLARADAVIAVSRLHMQFLERQQPELIGHSAYIMNAVNPFVQKTHRDYDGHGILTIAVSGGDRPIKGNKNVATAVKKLREQGIDCRLLIFGDIDGHNPGFDKILDEKWVTITGQLSHSLFLSRLQKVDVFVMNSVYETFGLSAIDALQAGCSLLISSNCGVKDVLDVKDEDVIKNIHDVGEIERKILYISQHSNAKKLYEAIDFNSLNWDSSSRRLRDICYAVVRGQDLRPFES